jgi:Domain of unknown function (DUF4263)
MCRVRLFIDVLGKVTALVTDFGDKNPGKSVTNAIEWIWRNLLERGHVDKSATLIQHHEREGKHGATFSRVTVDKRNQPTWHQMSLKEVYAHLGCQREELVTKTLRDERLAQQIESIRTRIDPFMDFPYTEPAEVIEHRELITAKMLSRRRITKAIVRGADERELQALLKKDLSIVAEVYAFPDEEYISFSEFPVGPGVVDFAVFSGRSVMDVTLIEVKGANFSLVNKTGYKNFAAKANEAAQQLKTRLGYIARNYEEFRTFAHAIRKKVEEGSPCYNSLTGPMRDLEVDPNKDIDVRYVVIAGRTANDLAESRVRREFEMSFNPRIKMESWDTWVRKLRRP